MQQDYRTVADSFRIAMPTGEVVDSLRHLMINQMAKIVDPSEAGQFNRWLPVRQWIFVNLMHKELISERGRAECQKIDLSNLELLLFTENLSNHQLIELYDIVILSWVRQM